MEKPRAEIKAKYALYKKLLEEKKIIPKHQLVLEPKDSGKNPRWLHNYCSINHTTVEENVALIVEKHKAGDKYGFKLKCSALSEKPFFRFDSDGPAHTNDYNGLSMEERQIPTPHFNCYDAEGRAIAYQSDVLKNGKEAQIIVDDINMGLSHYCHEAKISLSDGNFPEVLEKSPELDLRFDPIKDFFNGAKFE